MSRSVQQCTFCNRRENGGVYGQRDSNADDENARFWYCNDWCRGMHHHLVGVCTYPNKFFLEELEKRKPQMFARMMGTPARKIDRTTGAFIEPVHVATGQK